jgi:hypothetical protein
MFTVPASLESNVHTTLIVVDFPAPLGPKNANSSPSLTFKEMSDTALTDPYDFDK